MDDQNNEVTPEETAEDVVVPEGEEVTEDEEAPAAEGEEVAEDEEAAE